MRDVLPVALVLLFNFASQANEYVSFDLDSSPGRSIAEIIGPSNRIQLVALARGADGTTIDLTRKADYRTEPEGIVDVDPTTGVVLPLRNGGVRVVAEVGDLSATTNIEVKQLHNPPPLNFRNDVTPILTKFGCNSGGCHGKSGGQNGFALSLLGFEPQDDFQYIVKEGRGRRVFPAAPAESLLLKKATGDIPHGGGFRIKKSSYEYRVLRQWIEQGTPFGKDEDPRLSRISVFPEKSRLALDSELQLQVTAYYTDGSIRDVTNQAQFESNNTELSEVSESGLVKIKGRVGIVATMIRFQDQATAAMSTIPLAKHLGQLPPQNNEVDEFVFKQLRELGLPPSELADDATFIRRVTLDISGRLPTADESVEFLANPNVDKRKELIDRLLDSDDYANHFAQKWTAILRNRVQQNESRSGNFRFHEWVRESIASNVPYDQFVTRLIIAAGDVRTNPAVNWHLKFNKMEERSEDTAQVFLGQRIQCAKCHHHPYEKWAQEDYWRFAAFFANLGQKSGRRIYSKMGVPQARNARDQRMVIAAGLGAEPLDDSVRRDARVELAKWMTDKANPYFAKMLVNRYWKHFFDVGIVDPEDDIRSTNPPSNPELLSALEDHFIQSGYDLQDLIRTICNSSTYQLSSIPNAYNGHDRQSFSKFNPRRLPAEVMLDSIDSFLGSQSRFTGLPVGMQAIQIPDHGSANNSFLDAFGRPAGASACECERSGDVTMAQCLQLLNSDEIHQKLDSPRITKLANATEHEPREKIRQLHLHAFSREPREKEYDAYLSYLQSADVQSERDAYQDIMWTMINTKEFLFNH